MSSYDGDIDRLEYDPEDEEEDDEEMESFLGCGIGLETINRLDRPEFDLNSV